jgi:hypothetical protein
MHADRRVLLLVANLAATVTRPRIARLAGGPAIWVAAVDLAFAALTNVGATFGGGAARLTLDSTLGPATNTAVAVEVTTIERLFAGSAVTDAERQALDQAGACFGLTTAGTTITRR